MEEEAGERGVEILFLPENSTHLRKPLDVGVNGAFKSGVRRRTLAYIIEKDMQRLTALEGRKFIIETIYQTWTEDVTEEMVKKSFIQTGVICDTPYIELDSLNAPLRNLIKDRKLVIINQEEEKIDAIDENE